MALGMDIKPVFSPLAHSANRYCDLTDRFNADELSTLLAGGQAGMHYRTAFTAKDGDWLIRLEESAMRHVLSALSEHQAVFRFGSAPLDVRWHRGGWTSHLEFHADGLRYRTDFRGRPVHMTMGCLDRLWAKARTGAVPVVPLSYLMTLLQTQRDHHWSLVGALGQRLMDPHDILRWSLASDRLQTTAAKHPELARSLMAERPLLDVVLGGTERQVREALMRERLDAMDADMRDQSCFREVMEPWLGSWPTWAGEIRRMPAHEANALLIEKAKVLLPQQPIPAIQDDENPPWAADDIAKSLTGRRHDASVVTEPADLSRRFQDLGVDDQFQSSENNDLPYLSEEAFWSLYTDWFRQAQLTNTLDEHVFSHGAMLVEPGYEHLIAEVLHGTLG